ncbi:MAG TPA: short-chain dehydrogenase/reductase, partial [Afipia sp.]
SLLKTIPDGDAQSPYATFKHHLAARMRAFLDPRGFGVLSAEIVARTVFRAATVRRPRTRYSVGVIARLGPLGRALTPDRVVDVMTRWDVPVQGK